MAPCNIVRTLLQIRSQLFLSTLNCFFLTFAFFSQLCCGQSAHVDSIQQVSVDLLCYEALEQGEEVRLYPIPDAGLIAGGSINQGAEGAGLLARLGLRQQGHIRLNEVQGIAGCHANGAPNLHLLLLGWCCCLVLGRLNARSKGLLCYQAEACCN